MLRKAMTIDLKELNIYGQISAILDWYWAVSDAPVEDEGDQIGQAKMIVWMGECHEQIAKIVDDECVGVTRGVLKDTRSALGSFRSLHGPLSERLETIYQTVLAAYNAVVRALEREIFPPNHPLRKKAAADLTKEDIALMCRAVEERLSKKPIRFSKKLLSEP
jgi:hypothetical protein